MLRYLLLAAPLLAVAPPLAMPSTDTVRPGASAGAAKPGAPSDGARRGLAFAQQRCSACHGVTENTTSPNPESPPFQDIANRPGVTIDTLRQFLRDSHNYPAAMSFTVEEDQIGDLADYIATLHKADYRPVM